MRKGIGRGLFIPGLILSVWLAASAAADELGEIRFAIQGKGARWQAGETSMTRLSPAERQQRVGLRLPLLTGREAMLAPQISALELPGDFDWRNNGGSYVTGARDQGGCGDCWAFAAAAALESNVLLSQETPNVDLNLSEQVLVSCSGAGSCNGGSIDGASNFLQNLGLPLESCYPYTATDGACANVCPDWMSSAYRIVGWSWVALTSPTVETIRNALFAYGPLVTTMAVYQDFFSYQSGIYSHVSGNLAGYHAILIVGYDDPGRYFIAKNSWGTGWGENGFFKIAYSELESGVQFGQYTIAYVGTDPSCSFSLSDTARSFPAAGGTGSLAVTAAEGCSWTAQSQAA